MLTRIKRGAYLPWRSRQVALHAFQAWQEAVRAGAEPIIHTATDENCPTHLVVSHGYGVAAVDGKTKNGETP